MVLDILSGWLSDCLSGHPSCPSTLLGSLPANFRVIDVQRRRIIPAEPDCRFVALSYVWGTSSDTEKVLHAEKSNFSTLGEDEGLPVSRIPSTIEDAMEIRRRLMEE